MATYYFRNTGDVNWGTATNWSLSDGGPADGAVPTAADGARFTANSGNCTTNTSSRVCLTLICTGYIRTLTLTNQLTVGGTITLSATMTIAGVARLLLSASATITGNGCLIPLLRIGSAGSITCTLGDVLSVNDLLVAGNNAATFTINGNSININTNLTIGTGGNTNTSTGTTVFNLVGTGTWSHNVSATQLRNTTNINTSGTITCSGTLSYGVGGLTYVTGTVNALSATLTVLSAATLNVNGINWGAVTMGNSVTITLSSNLQCNGNFIFGSTTASSTVLNGNTITVGGNLSTAATSGVLSGTTIIEMIGTGSVNLTTQSTGSFRSPLRINTSGTITIVGSMRVANSSITHVSGTVVTTGSTLTILGSYTLDTNGRPFYGVSTITSEGINFNNIDIPTASVTVTLSSPLTCVGTFSYLSATTGTVTINGSTMYLNGTVSCGSNSVASILTGTTQAVYNGNGRWIGAGLFSLNLDINTLGVLIFDENYAAGTVTSLNLGSNSKTFRYIEGQVKTNSQDTVLSIQTSTFIGFNKLMFPLISVVAGNTITMDEFFSGSPSFPTTIYSSVAGTAYTIAFTNQFEKIAKSIAITDCTLSQPLQLIVITKMVNNGTNRGIRYINQLPNKFALNNPSVMNAMTYPAFSLTSDPTIN